MKARVVMFTALMVFLIGASSAFAGDFDWLKELNFQAMADPAGFRARIAARFKIGDAEITTVISNVEKPADAYMVFRLGEMSHQPLDHVMKRYQSRKGQGWGVLAKNLGIKPGSKEFHALKRGHDLYDDNARGKGQGKSKGKGNGKGKGKNH
jgi:hypothetical protein